MAYTKLAAGLLALAVTALAGCVEDTGTSGAVTLPAGGAPGADISACLAAVGNQTGNTVSVLSTETSEANNTVIVGVGPANAPWRCLVKNASVAEVMSLTNEGAL